MVELIEAQASSGLTLYAHVRNSTGQAWNGSAFENYLVANWSTYCTALTEDSLSGYYKATGPTLSSGRYPYLIYQQLGGSPAAGDPVIGSGALGDRLSGYRLDQLISATAGGTPATAGSFLDLIMNKNAGQTFDRSTDSLEALRDSGTGPTSAQIAAAVWDELLSGHSTSGTAGKALSDIFSKLPSGNISGFDTSVDRVNLNTNQSGVTIGTVNSLGSTALSQINSEVVDVMFVDTIPELASIPGASPTFAKGLMLLYMALRNKRTGTGTQERIYNNGDTAIATAVTSDDGTTATKEKYS